MKKNFCKLLHILLGINGAILTLWGCGILFCRNYVPIVYCNDLERNIYKPGIKIKSTKEGYAITKCGGNGIIAPFLGENIDTNAVLLFGNSFAEGLHVPDKVKMHQVANNILLSSKKELVVYNVAMSSQLFCDTLWQIPKYLKKYDDHIKGIIVLVMRHDLLPSSKSSIYGCSASVKKGELHISPPHPAHMTRIGAIKYKYCLEAFLVFGKNIQTSISTWYINMIKKTQESIPLNSVEQVENDFSSEYNDMYINLQLEKLRASTDLPILLLVCVDKPFRGSNGIEAMAEDSLLTKKIKLYAQKNNIEFYSMREEFNQLSNDYFIVCGFPNTLPGEGHFSKYAHKVIGEKIAMWCTEKVCNEESQK